MNADFRQHGYVNLKRVISPQTCQLLATEFLMYKDTLYAEHREDLLDKRAFEDVQVRCSFACFGHRIFEALMVMLQPVVENTTGKSLYPSYSYARIMWAGAAMTIHKDRPSCEYSVSACIAPDPDCPYPIFFQNYAGEATPTTQNVGDIVVYHGTEVAHFREEFKGREHVQAFLHYVDADGPYAKHRFDGRPMLGTPPRQLT